MFWYNITFIVGLIAGWVIYDLAHRSNVRDWADKLYQERRDRLICEQTLKEIQKPFSVEG